jgi:energy-coupling factor transporter ATP-binding protein EcfA2
MSKASFINSSQDTAESWTNDSSWESTNNMVGSTVQTTEVTNQANNGNTEKAAEDFDQDQYDNYHNVEMDEWSNPEQNYTEEENQENLKTDPGIVKEIKSKISQGYKLISSEEDVILVVGNTGSGKSTLVNYLAGTRLIAEKKGFGKVVLSVPEPVSPEMTVSHKLVSETTVPNSWKDNNLKVVYWDCPGFDDNRGAVQDIANAFYIKKLFDSSKTIKIIAVTTESSFTESRGAEFMNLMGHLSSLFVDVESFKQGLSLVVTKTNADSCVSDVSSAIEELITEQAETIAKNPKQKQILEYLAKSQDQVALFPAPKKAGEVSDESRNVILSVIQSTKPVNNSAVNITISDKSKLYMKDLITAVNNQIIEDMISSCKKIEDKLVGLSDIENVSLNKVPNSITLLKELGKELSNFVGEKFYSVDRFVTKFKSFEIVSEEIRQSVAEHIQCLNFCQTVSPLSKEVYSMVSWLSPIQGLNMKVNTNGGHIDTVNGYVRKTVYKELEKLMISFSKITEEKCLSIFDGVNEDKSGNKKYEQVLNLKQYVEVFGNINNIMRSNDSDKLEKLFDKIEQELLKKFGLDNKFVEDLKLFASTLNLLSPQDIDQYTSQLGNYLLGFDYSRNLRQELDNLSQNLYVNFKYHVDGFFKVIIENFADRNPFQAKAVAISLNRLDKALNAELTVSEILKQIQELFSSETNVPTEELSKASEYFDKLENLRNNDIGIFVPDKNDFREKVLNFSQQVGNIFYNYTQKKIKELDVKMMQSVEFCALKILEAYYIFAEKNKSGDKEQKAKIINILKKTLLFKEGLENASKAEELLNSFCIIQDELGQILNLAAINDSLSELKSIVNDSALLGHSESGKAVWDSNIQKLMVEITEDVQKDIVAIEAKNSILRIFTDIEEKLDKLMSKCSDLEESRTKLETLKDSLSLVEEVIEGKNIADFVKILKQNIDQEFFKNRKAVMEKTFKKICEAKNLLIDKDIITPINNLIDKINDEIDWYSHLTKIYTNFSNKVFSSKIQHKLPDHIDNSNFSSVLKEMSSDDFGFVYTPSRATQLSSMVECNSRSDLVVKLSQDQKVVSITGNFIKISEILPHITSSTKGIKLKSFSTVIFDADIIAKGANLAIIAPKWFVDKNVVIDLSGKDAPNHSSSKAIDSYGYSGKDGVHGKDGLPGISGSKGGSFYGNGQEFTNLEQLTVNVSGGKGGNGQEGGNGSNGQDNSRHANESNYSSYEVDDSSGRINNYWYLRKKFDAEKRDCRFDYNQIKLYKGFSGGKGGDAGKGGAEGVGGIAGTVKLFCGNQEKYIDLVSEEGQWGEAGNSGEAGKGGKDSNNLKVYIGRAVSFPEIKKARYQEKNKNNYGSDGKIPKDKNTYKNTNTKKDDDWFDLFVSETKQEYISHHDQINSTKFYLKIQKTCLTKFFEQLMMSGNGLVADDESKPAESTNYSEELNKYYATGIDNLLKLRIDKLLDNDLIKNTDQIEILKANYLFTDLYLNSEKQLVNDILTALTNGKNIILVPYNLYGKHWVGAVVEKNSDNLLVFNYIDPENNNVPEQLHKNIEFELIQKGYKSFFNTISVEHQNKGNCGPELIENIVYYLTGSRLPQNEVLALHTQLFEEDLLALENASSIDLLGQMN